MGFDRTVVTTFPCETFLGIVGVSGKVAVGCVVIISGEVVVGGIVGISVEVTVGGIFSFGAMAVGGGNVAVGLGFGSTVVVNVVDIVCLFCFCCVLGGGVVDPDLLLDRLRSLTKSTTFPCETFTIAS